jgi:exonuclease SbcD
MRIMHTSDLHIGKKLSKLDMSEDQEYILNSIVDMVVSEGVDALLIAGDVYDRTSPSEDAMELFGSFLTRMSETGCPVFISSGNHDSGKRLDYCSGILRSRDIHMTGKFKGCTERFELSADSPKVHIHMLPFVRPHTVNVTCGTDVSGLDAAVRVVLERSDIDPEAVNILVAHQFVRDISGGEMSFGSEELRPSVGGSDLLASDVLDAFDYVALGHLHVPQNVGSDRVRYSGSPLKYSESEARVDKSVTIIDISDKGDISVSAMPLKPLSDLRVIKGTMEEVIDSGCSDDYIYVILDDIEDRPEPTFRKQFPRLCGLTFSTLRANRPTSRLSMEEVKTGSIDELFMRFYNEITGQDLTGSQMAILEEALSRNGGDAE